MLSREVALVEGHAATYWEENEMRSNRNRLKLSDSGWLTDPDRDGATETTLLCKKKHSLELWLSLQAT